MKIEYRLNLKDYQEANKFNLKAQKVKYLALWIASCILTISAILYLIFLSDIYNSIFWLAIATLINPEVNLLNKIFLSLAWKNQSNAVREPVEIEITQEGLAKEASSYRSFVRWQIFTKFIETPNLFILVEGKLLMHIIPKRAFSHNEQIQEFKALLNEKIRSSN